MQQLLNMLDKWTHDLESGGQIDAVYTDFEKAFEIQSCTPQKTAKQDTILWYSQGINKLDWSLSVRQDIYTVGHKKHQNLFHHNFHKTRPILNKFGGLLVK